MGHLKLKYDVWNFMQPAPQALKFQKLEDDIALQGNCKNAWPKKAILYPCFNKDVTYGLAIEGLNMFGFDSAPRVRLDVDSPWEPRVRYGEPQAKLKGSLTVEGLIPGRHYIVYRFNSTDALPDGVSIDLLDVGFEYRYGFKAQSTTLKFEDPHPIMSDSSTYYVAVRASKLHEDAIDSLKDPTPREFLKVAVAVGEGSSELKTISRPKDLDADMSKLPYFKSLAARTLQNPAFAKNSFATLIALMTFAVVIGGRCIFLRTRSRTEVLPQPLL